jgi:hypothetical protein
MGAEQISCFGFEGSSSGERWPEEAASREGQGLEENWRLSIILHNARIEDRPEPLR